MVRRWSSINKFNINYNLNKIIFFKKLSKKRIFKLTVSTRKFYKRYTRFRRRSFNRLKHKSNWSFYWNIWKFWCQNFQSSRTFYKKYWLINLYKFNFLQFNLNSLKLVEHNLFVNNFYTMVSNNAFFNFCKNKNKNSILYYINNEIANTSLASTESLIEIENELNLDKNLFDIYLYAESQIFQNNLSDYTYFKSYLNNNFLLFNFDFFFFNQILIIYNYLLNITTFSINI